MAPFGSERARRPKISPARDAHRAALAGRRGRVLTSGPCPPPPSPGEALPRLRRSDCSRPGLGRRRRGRGFSYLDESGKTITDPEVIERLNALAIPPAWREVWICPRPPGPPAGHRHRRRRTQAVPLPPALARAPRSAEVRRDARLRAGAAAVAAPRAARPPRRGPRPRARPGRRRAPARHRLLSRRQRGLRGAERDARPVHHPARAGLDAGWPDRLRLPGQGRPATDPVGRRPRHRRRRAGAQAAAGRQRKAAGLSRRPPLGRRGRDDINAYLKRAAGGDFSAKDFRTWNATVLAAVALAATGRDATSAAAASA